MDELEKAVARFNRRCDTFTSEGLDTDAAYNLAAQMYERDLDPLDDRRVCFECRHLLGNLCMKIRDSRERPQTPLRFMLQRCENFSLKGKK
jgi:hypothetical protein